MRLLLINIILLFSFNICFCQQMLSSYSILNNNCTARNSSLGGYPIGLFDSDPSLAIFLPSNLSILNKNQLVLNYNNHFADSDFGMINYNFQINKKGIFSTTLFYNNYGKFEYFDASGNSLGNSFSANDWILQIGHSKKLHDKLQIGLNLKFIASIYEQYSSYAVGSDLSLTYFDNQKQFGGYLLLSNVGTTLKNYNNLSNYNNKLPFNSVIGINSKLKHAPLRFHISYNHLHKWSFNNESNLNPSEAIDFNTIFNQFFNHFVFGTELLFSENFNVRLGYDLLSRNELQPTSRPGTTGISWGVGFKVKGFKINYSNSKYHFSGVSNNLTIVKKLNFN
ncbi:MAG: type IX secretion system protein PorQ [Parvicellaceae bacterium]